MTSPLKIRILLADDHAMVRRGLRMVLDSQPDLEVVDEVGDGAKARAEHQPDPVGGLDALVEEVERAGGARGDRFRGAQLDRARA